MTHPYCAHCGANMNDLGVFQVFTQRHYQRINLSERPITFGDVGIDDDYTNHLFCQCAECLEPVTPEQEAELQEICS